jgi:hypothetical protein
MKCRICRSHRSNRAGMAEHLAEHRPDVLAEELLRALERAAEMQSLAAMAERCGKFGYKTEQSATRAMLVIWERYGNDPMRRETRVYQCHRCGGRWHLTSQPMRQSEAS